MWWKTLVQGLLGTEEEIIPMVVHNPNSKGAKVVAIVFAVESVVAAAFGIPLPTPVTPPSSTPQVNQ